MLTQTNYQIDVKYFFSYRENTFDETTLNVNSYIKQPLTIIEKDSNFFYSYRFQRTTLKITDNIWWFGVGNRYDESYFLKAFD